MQYLERSTYVSLALVLLALLAGFFVPGAVAQAKVLYEHTEIGTSYDLFTSLGANDTGYLNITPQFDGNGTFAYVGGGVPFEGTVDWFRVKRVSGLPCDGPFNISLFSTDGAPIGNGSTVWGKIDGPYCDFPIVGPNRTNQAVGFIAICVNYDCDGIPSFVLDGSPKNPGYIFDGTMTIRETGGWAFQLCDAEGCGEGFGIDSGTSTATSTDPGTGTTTATSTATSTPSGASSVLFLPGIQASRLYTKGLLGSEDQLWEPNINNDVAALAMDENGVSINDVYTRDVVNEIFGVSNVYKTFINQMNLLKSDEKIIENFVPFAYDWRFSVEDVVANGVQYESEIKNLVATVEALAGDSFTKKVTIIAHSNGGLLGKALITELENQGKAKLIDKLVMVGTPQLGASKAIGVMLHGYDQRAGGGIIIDDVTARDVVKNMPGAYSLLPSPKYFEKSIEPVVSADTSNATAAIQAYGVIDSATELKNFLLDSNNLRESNPARINNPSVLNHTLFSNNEAIQSRLDNWRAPQNVAVYEVVGTGINTIRGFEYRAFPCSQVICGSGSLMKPYPLFSSDGDETVMALSASGYEGAKVTAKVDLDAEGDGILNREYEHSNLTESPTVQDFVDAIIRFPYVSDTVVVPPNFIDVTRKYTIIGAHSPVALSVEDKNGLKVGRAGDQINEEVPGSQFVELGGSTYIILPADTEYTATVAGTGEGVYSLTIDSLNGDLQTSEFKYMGASTSLLMKATFTASSSGFSNLKTDSNGDGQTDLEQTLNGEIILPPVVYTYVDLRNAISALTIPRVTKQLLLLQVTLAEHFSLLSKSKPRQQLLEQKTLKAIEDTLKIMEKKRLLLNTDAVKLYAIINQLKK